MRTEPSVCLDLLCLDGFHLASEVRDHVVQVAVHMLGLGPDLGPLLLRKRSART